jgi:hypothetical protein
MLGLSCVLLSFGKSVICESTVVFPAYGLIGVCKLGRICVNSLPIHSGLSK